MLDEANRIKDRLRACKTAAEVHKVADEEREAVRSMAKTDNVLAIHIVNLKAYMLNYLKG